MKLGDDTHSGQQRVLKPQDLEAISSMMYNVSLHQVKQGNHLNLKFIREEEEVRDKVIIEIDPEITIDKGKILVKIDMVITIEEMGTCKMLVEIIAEKEAEILTETIIVTGAGQEKKYCLPEGIIVMITIDKMQTLDSDQGPGVDPTQE